MSNQGGKHLGTIRIVAALIAVTFAFYFGPAAVQLYQVIHLYDEDKIVENFLHMDRIFPVRNVKAPEATFGFHQALVPLPESFSLDGVEHDTRDYLEYSRSTGMLVLKDDVNVFEEYPERGKYASSGA